MGKDTVRATMLAAAALGALAAPVGVERTSAQPVDRVRDGLVLPPVGWRDCTAGRVDPPSRYTSPGGWGEQDWLSWGWIATHQHHLFNVFAKAAEDIQSRLERVRCHQAMTAEKSNFLTPPSVVFLRCPRGLPNPPYDRPGDTADGTGGPDAAAAFSKTVFNFRSRTDALDDLKTRVEAIRCEEAAVAAQLRAVPRVAGVFPLTPGGPRQCRAEAESSYVTPSYTYGSGATNRDYGIILTSYSYFRRETLVQLTDLQGRIEEVRCLQSAVKDALEPLIRDPAWYTLARRGQPQIQRDARRTPGRERGMEPRPRASAAPGPERSSRRIPEFEMRPQPPHVPCPLAPANPSYDTDDLHQQVGDAGGDPWPSFVSNKITEGAAELVTALDDMQARIARVQCEQGNIDAQLDFLIDRPP
jgi:hypothetical protein